MEEKREKGTIKKKWKERIPVCVVYPNTYYIGMSNLALHLIYSTLNRVDAYLCERAFLSEKIVSEESGHRLKFFDILFFTLSFELDYINIPRILKDSDIPVLSQERTGKPLIVAGGICVMANPEPISEIFDLFILGDVEVTLLQFMERYSMVREKKREEIIDELSQLEYVYNPKRLGVKYRADGLIEGFIPQDFKVSIRRYKGRKLASSAIITEQTEFSSMFLFEGTRGCPSKCPFCMTGTLYDFQVDHSFDIMAEVEDIGIIGGGLSFHPGLYEFLKSLKGKNKRIHLPSLRLDEVSLEIIDLLKHDIKTLTFGIEAGTEKLRNFLGKPMKNEEILKRIEEIFKIKPFNIKLYFMVGIYGEERKDLEEIVELVKGIRHVMLKECAKKGKLPLLTVHLNPFIPKAATPFQWLPMEERGVLKEKIYSIKKALEKLRNVAFTHESIKYSFIQALFSRGDRRIGKVVIELAQGKGIREIERTSPLNLNFYVLRMREEKEIFPWDFIKGREKDLLLNRLKDALSLLSSL